MVYYEDSPGFKEKLLRAIYLNRTHHKPVSITLFIPPLWENELKNNISTDYTQDFIVKTIRSVIFYGNVSYLQLCTPLTISLNETVFRSMLCTIQSCVIYLNYGYQNIYYHIQISPLLYSRQTEELLMDTLYYIQKSNEKFQKMDEYSKYNKKDLLVVTFMIGNNYVKNTEAILKCLIDKTITKNNKTKKLFNNVNNKLDTDEDQRKADEQKCSAVSVECNSEQKKSDIDNSLENLTTEKKEGRNEIGDGDEREEITSTNTTKIVQLNAEQIKENINELNSMMNINTSINTFESVMDTTETRTSYKMTDAVSSSIADITSPFVDQTNTNQEKFENKKLVPFNNSNSKSKTKKILPKLFHIRKNNGWFRLFSKKGDIAKVIQYNKKNKSFQDLINPPELQELTKEIKEFLCQDSTESHLSNSVATSTTISSISSADDNEQKINEEPILTKKQPSIFGLTKSVNDIINGNALQRRTFLNSQGCSVDNNNNELIKNRENYEKNERSHLKFSSVFLVDEQNNYNEIIIKNSMLLNYCETNYNYLALNGYFNNTVLNWNAELHLTRNWLKKSLQLVQLHRPADIIVIPKQLLIDYNYSEFMCRDMVETPVKSIIIDNIDIKFGDCVEIFKVLNTWSSKVLDRHFEKYIRRSTRKTIEFLSKCFKTLIGYIEKRKLMRDAKLLNMPKEYMYEAELFKVIAKQNNAKNVRELAKRMRKENISIIGEATSLKNINCNINKNCDNNKSFTLHSNKVDPVDISYLLDNELMPGDSMSMCDHCADPTQMHIAVAENSLDNTMQKQTVSKPNKTIKKDNQQIDKMKFNGTTNTDDNINISCLGGNNGKIINTDERHMKSDVKTKNNNSNEIKVIKICNNSDDDLESNASSHVVLNEFTAEDKECKKFKWDLVCESSSSSIVSQDK